MRKEVLSLRLEPEIIKWINSKTTETKNKSEVVQQLLYMAMQKEKTGPEMGHVSLQAKATKASILTLRMLELFLKMPDEKGIDVCKRAHALYKKDLEGAAAETEAI